MALERMLEYARALQSVTTLSELLTTTRGELERTVGYHHVWLFVADDPAVERMRLIDAGGALRDDVWNVAPVLTIAGDAMLEEIVRGPDPVVVVDARIDPRTNKAIVAQLGNRTIVNVPLRLADRTFAAFGTGTFGDEGCREPTRPELDHLVAMAKQLAGALSRIRAIDERIDAAVRASEGRYRRVLESTHEGFIEMDREGTITEWNAQAEAMFGWSRSEALGRRVADTVVPTAMREAHLRGLATYVRTGEGPILGKRIELLGARRDGETFPIELTISEIDDGAAPRFAAFVHDISDRRRSAEALTAARDGAESTMRDYEAFSYSVAHDLRAPLRAIDGFSHALLEDHGASLDDEGRRMLGRIGDASRRMAQLIDALLGLARLTRSEMKRTHVDLSALARDIMARLTAAEPDRQVDVVVADDLATTGDKLLLAAVLDNLLGNAWKFTRRRPAARIEVGRHREAGRDVVFVRDNGAGFDMAYAAKLFGVFQRLHATDEFEGTGIGLATVQRIIRRHGGQVWATGTVGAGATFYFTLDERTTGG